MGQNQQLVIIKGSKDGIALHLNDSCSYDDLLNEIDEKLSASQFNNSDSPLTSVHLKIGNRFFTQEQEEEIRKLIREKNNLIVETIDCQVVSIEEAVRWKEDNEITSVANIIRSGQVLKVKGDLLLIGDVNAGATVIAGGNIFVLGVLRGIAHAGYDGNRQAIIAASVMQPMQLRICEVMNRAPDNTIFEDGNEMECAYIDEENHIVVDSIRKLRHLRPNLTRLERSV